MLTWLAAFFGPARQDHRVRLVPASKQRHSRRNHGARFHRRLHRSRRTELSRASPAGSSPLATTWLRVIGDDGVLFVGNVRNDHAPVIVRSSKLWRWRSRLAQRTQWLHRWLEERFPWPGAETMFQRTYPLVRQPAVRVGGHKPVDFMRGPSEMTEAIRERRPCRLSAELGVHIVEIVEALDDPGRFGGYRRLATTFPPMHPMTWAA